jgi:hypothetical protein
MLCRVLKPISCSSELTCTPPNPIGCILCPDLKRRRLSVRGLHVIVMGVMCRQDNVRILPEGARRVVKALSLEKKPLAYSTSHDTGQFHACLAYRRYRTRIR